MEFEEMKVIWNSQTEEPLYAVNEDGLHAVLRQKSQELRRLIFWQVAQTYGSALFSVSVISIALIVHFKGALDNPTTSWDALALLVAAGSWLYFAGAVYFGRKRQKQRESKFTSSLRDELDRDIAQVGYQISKRKHIMLGFLPPYTGGVLFTLVVFRMSGMTEWAIVPFIAFMVVALVWETRSQQRLVDLKFLPRKRELESLRDKLVSAE